MTPSTPAQLAVYACKADSLLFVPDLCLPPRDAEQMFGPLVHRGSVAVPEPQGAWEGIIGQIDRHLFAIVSRREADLLIGTTSALVPAGSAATA